MPHLTEPTVATIVRRLAEIEPVGRGLFYTTLLFMVRSEESQLVQALSELEDGAVAVDEGFVRQCFDLLDVNGRVEVIGSHAAARASAKLFEYMLAVIRRSRLQARQRTLLSYAIRTAAARHPEIEELRPLGIRYLSSKLVDERINGLLVLGDLTPTRAAVNLIARHLSAKDRRVRLAAWFAIRRALSETFPLSSRLKKVIENAARRASANRDPDVRREAQTALTRLVDRDDR